MSEILRKTGMGVVFPLLLVGLMVQAPLQGNRVSSEQAEGDGFGGSRFSDRRTAANVWAAYEKWKTAYVADGGDRTLKLTLRWSKSLSAEFSEAHGVARFDLIGGTVDVEVQGLSEENRYAVWLVDNTDGVGHSVLPEPEDRMVRLGTLTQQRETARLHAPLKRNDLPGFHVDLVVVTSEDEDPGTGGLLFGSPSLFQRLYLGSSMGTVGVPVDEEVAPVAAGIGDGFFRSLFAPSQPARGLPLDDLVQIGEAIFFNTQFQGNGRTCGTCHPRENNFTIDPDFIATLPPDDPLFVAEFTPALNYETNGGRYFENPVLMRAGGLIVENVDGFDDLTSRFVMRSVPHLSAANLYLTPGDDGTTTPPDQRTGWSGDGAPGSGALRDFATGAVTQHFPRTLRRRPGRDFRLPTEFELDALEAFILSLGRQEDLDIASMQFQDTDVTTGQQLFLGEAKCHTCHRNAGANFVDAPEKNHNFNTGVEDFPSPFAPLGEPLPRDGGFGQTPDGDGAGGFGDGTFNPQPLVEAGDTAPFFHNNIADDLNPAVAFYNSDAFNNSPGGAFVGGIDLSELEVFQVTAFLYVLNVLENGRITTDLLADAKRTPANREAREILELALAENDDAIESMEDAEVQPAVVEILEEVGNHIEAAHDAAGRRKRALEIDTALALLDDVRSSLIIDGNARLAHGKATAAAVPLQEEAPEGYALEQNYPNPFNPSTEIRFELPEASDVVVRVFNSLGQEINRLADRRYDAGVHRVRWDGRAADGREAASGLYFYQLEAGAFVETKQMVLVR